MTKRPDLSIVIVSWNVKALLLDCLAAVERTRGDLDLQVLVVDNDSMDGSAEAVARTYPDVELVASEINLGFPLGNNLGLLLGWAIREGFQTGWLRTELREDGIFFRGVFIFFGFELFLGAGFHIGSRGCHGDLRRWLAGHCNARGIRRFRLRDHRSFANDAGGSRVRRRL